MSYRSERFNRRMMSLEVMVAGFADVSKAKIFSDGGAGARAIREGQGLRSRSTAEDAFFSDTYPPPKASRSDGYSGAGCRVYEKTHEEKLFEAESRLVDAGKGYLIRTLLLIVENGENREESLKHVARRTYYRHRDELMRFFHCPPPPHL